MRKRFGSFAFFLASLVLASFFASPALAGRRVALVIGNSEYEHISRLENPINDAEDVAATLRKLDFEIIPVLNADRDRFEQALVDFGREASGAELALVYYAGHGVEHAGANYLLPTDIAGDQGAVEIKAIDTGKVRRQLDKATGVKILILDACRNDPFGVRGLERASIGSEGPAKGMLIVYAAAPGQVAIDGRGHRNSPFAEALVDHLKNASGVEIRTLFNQVANKVSAKTNGKQLPNINSLIDKDFYFLSPDEMCERVWKKAVDSQEPADFKAIVTNYPTCRRAYWAQARLDLFGYHQVCDAENKKLDAIGAYDLDSLINAAEQMKCEAVRTEARKRADAERARRDAQVARQKTEQDCEAARIKAQVAVSAYDLDGLRTIGGSTKCDAVRTQAEADIAKLQRLCDDERNAFDAVPANDLDRLSAAAVNIHCKAIQSVASERIEKLEWVCAKDGKALDAVPADDLNELKAVTATIACIAIQKDAAERVAKLDRACEADRKQLRSIRDDDKDSLLAARDQMKCRQIRDILDQRIAAISSEWKLACDKAREALEGKPKGVAALTAILAKTPSTCPDVIANINSAVKEANCDADAVAITKMSDLRGLREAADDPRSCEKARVAAREKIDGFERICKEERDSVARIDMTSFDAQAQLKALSAKALSCPEARVDLGRKTESVKARVQETQQQLQRLGCYNGPLLGEFNPATKDALLDYAHKMGQTEPTRLTSILLEELKKQTEHCVIAGADADQEPQSGGSKPGHGTKVGGGGKPGHGTKVGGGGKPGHGTKVGGGGKPGHGTKVGGGGNGEGSGGSGSHGSGEISRPNPNRLFEGMHGVN